MALLCLSCLARPPSPWLLTLGPALAENVDVKIDYNLQLGLPELAKSLQFNLSACLHQHVLWFFGASALDTQLLLIFKASPASHVARGKRCDYQYGFCARSPIPTTSSSLRSCQGRCFIPHTAVGCGVRCERDPCEFCEPRQDGDDQMMSKSFFNNVQIHKNWLNQSWISLDSDIIVCIWELSKRSMKGVSSYVL